MDLAKISEKCCYTERYVGTALGLTEAELDMMFINASKL